MTSGTIGGGVTSQVIEDIHEVLKQAKVKNATLNYLSAKVTPNNIKGLQESLAGMDTSKDGFLQNQDFMRCLS